MSKVILGLDLGTNSIGWALIEIDHEKGIVRILGLGSRILPMTADEIGDFGRGAPIVSGAAFRTEKRGPRRLNERFLLRRDRLHLVLNLLEALPDHYKLDIDFTNGKGEKSGQFKLNKEPKLAYLPKQQNKKAQFLFRDSYKEMLNESGIVDEKKSRIPYDWTLYYLRQKALSKQISLEELAWVLLSYNQKRGYEKLEVEANATKDSEIVEELDLRVKSVEKKIDKDGDTFFQIDLDGSRNISYNEYSSEQLTFENDIKEVRVTSYVDEKGNVNTEKTVFTIVDIYPLTIVNVKYENENNKHHYHLTYNNGWQQTKTKAKYTFQFEKAINKSYDYVVETTYDRLGNIKTQSGLDRKLREPDFGDNSNDWTLLKKKTEKEALVFNLATFNEPKKFISPKIYSILKQDAISGNRTKIIGGMFQTVDRSFYREELKQIISTQRQFHQALNEKDVFEKCVKLLYPNNESHAKTLLTNKDAIQHLLIEDILLYQRPLKSKKSEIADCKFEIKYTKDALDGKGNPIEIANKETGEITYKQEIIRHKVVPASHPYYQEFRIWDKLHNLKIIQLEQTIEGKVQTNVDVTKQFFSDELYSKLFELLNNQKSLTNGGFMKFLAPIFKANKWNDKDFVWNFTEDDEIKGNTTRVDFAVRFKRCGFTDYLSFLTQEKERMLWHYLYSVSYKERIENDFKSLRSFFQNTFFKDFDIDEAIVENLVQDFANFPKFDSKYGAYSEKALKKLLPQMKLINDRTYAWEKEEYFIKFNERLNARKQEILNKLNQIDFSAEVIDYTKVVDNSTEIPFPKGLFNVFSDVQNESDFSKLNLTKTSYLIYGRHSELEQAKYWHSPEQIRRELHQELKQHSLNNPIAEKVLLEMMQVVADIWDKYGDGKQDYFKEIHVEVARELKKSAKEKANDTTRNKENKAQNDRLRQILEEFLSVDNYKAKPKNTDHFERLKIVEDGASHTKNTNKEFFNDKSYTKKEIDDILKKSKITKEDFDKYKLWIEQGYKSPYTNRIIRLTDLFDGNKYNVDHILPRASVTNDSLSNKVVCEKEINKEKSNKTAREFILNPTNRNIYCSAHNGFVELVNDGDFTDIVKTQFSGTKRFILLSKDVPREFTSSQLNNARHIARKAMELLSHIVREEGEVEFLSKNVLPVTGEITSKLKRAWKLDHVWKQLVAPRFIRMNELTDSNLFGSWQEDKNGNSFFDCNLDELIREKNPNFDIKRIDHRHHALDALVVALCTREHVNYINNINADAKSDNFGKQNQIEKYRETLKRKIQFSKPNKENPNDEDWFYMLPGERRKENGKNSSRESVLTVNYWFDNKDYGKEVNHFATMVFDVLNGTTTSFKQKLRVINNTINRYQVGNRELKTQNSDKGQEKNWSIRRSLGKGTMYGKIDIGETEKRQLFKNIDFFFENPESIIDKNLKLKILLALELNLSKVDFEKYIKANIKNSNVECISYKAVSRYNSHLDISFSKERIKTIVDKGIREILRKYLEKYDTVVLPFDKAINDFDFLLEKNEFKKIMFDENLNTVEELKTFLFSSNYKYKKSDYSKVNLFINDFKDYDYRNDVDFMDKIIDHPEIAFTPEFIVELNNLNYLKELNNGKNHHPILKVRTYTTFGNEKQVSSNKEGVKSRQYVKVDKGTNFYLAVYEIKNKENISKANPERLFKEINLFDLIEYQKSTNTNQLPIEKIIYSESGEQYDFLFTLTQNDLVSFEVNGNQNYFSFNRFTGTDIYFKPVNHSTEIDKGEIDKKRNKETGKISGSQVNETTSFGGIQIKNICIKLKVDRLGNISKA